MDAAALPPSALAALADRPFGVYVHVPFCAARCGYCDFNTYLSGDHGAYVTAVERELGLAREVLGAGAPPASTVFFGGGTPSLIGAPRLVRILDAIRVALGLAGDAEVTVECNPEDTSAAMLAELRAAGFTRVSLGMQSAVPRVLRALDRRHTPGRAVAAAVEARAAGFEHVSLDLIYGAAAETDADWVASLDAAVAARPDHVSVYGLTVEPGTRLAARVARDAAAGPNEDAQARRHLHAEERLAAAGYEQYEVSSWAATPASRCRHNEGYWTSANWWGAGPGAHSHVGGVRWANVLRPAAYAARLARGESPAASHEVLTPEQQAAERVLLGLRRAAGLPLAGLGPRGRAAAPEQAEGGWLDGEALADGRAALTRRGRLVADAVALALIE
ncbi:MAG TPA: radical SAM family heme chaperone HemW [Solirubrobacteraceae bacterium]